MFKSILNPDTEIISIVKANAYGHGLKEVVECLDETTDWFGVNSFEEFLEARKLSGKPILILGYVEKGNLEECVKQKATLGVYDIERIQILNAIGAKLNKKVKIHLKIDTFLGRQGILPDKLAEIANQIKALENIQIEAIYSHFANIEDTSDFTHPIKQISTFAQCECILIDTGFTNVQKHISASSGILVYDQISSPISNTVGFQECESLKETTNNSLVRLGISLYGIWPSPDLQRRFETNNFKLKSALKWITHIAQVKTLPPHYPIGYGLTYITSKETKIAIIPQGYSDGYDRGLSNFGEILIQGTRCKVLGRVAMNMFAVDVSHLDNVNAEDEVVLIGQQGDEEITADEIALKLNTIPYEIIARISPLLYRKVII